MKRIQLPSFGKRFAAFMIDLAIGVGLTCFFYFIVFSKVVSDVQHFDVIRENINQERIKSNLYVKNSKGETVLITDNDSSITGENLTKQFVEKFYTDYMVTKDKKYTQYYFCTHILYLTNKDGTEEGKATKPEGFVNVFKWTNETVGKHDYEVKDEYKSKPGDVKEFAKVILNNAVTLLNSSDPIKGMNRSIAWGNLRAVMYSSMIGTLIPYLCIPLILKNGKTVGKLCLHLSLLTDDGYYYKKYKLIFRYLAFYFVEVFGGAVTILLTFMLSSIMVIFSKKKRALHDYIAFSVVIDDKYSVFFKDEKEEQHYIELKEKQDKVK